MPLYLSENLIFLYCSYIKTNGKPHNQLVITNADATSSIVSSLSSDICSAKAIALFDQPEVNIDEKKKMFYNFFFE